MGDFLQCAPHGRKLHGTLHAHKISPEEEEEEGVGAGGRWVQSGVWADVRTRLQDAGRTEDARKSNRTAYSWTVDDNVWTPAVKFGLNRAILCVEPQVQQVLFCVAN